jgi:hypothetical protein
LWRDFSVLKKREILYQQIASTNQESIAYERPESVKPVRNQSLSLSGILIFTVVPDKKKDKKRESYVSNSLCHQGAST